MSMDVRGPGEESGVDLSIVVPLYNESESVVPLIQAIDRSLKEFREGQVGSASGEAEPAALKIGRRCELILVDDGSLDDTVATALQAAAEVEFPVRVIALQRNFGQTAALQAGIDASTGRLIATLDGDLQNDPADIPRMVEHLESNRLDLLVGRRLKRQDGLVLRLIPSWIANRLIAKVTGVNVRDYGCGLKIYRSSVIKQIRLLGEMHRFIPAWVASVTHPSKIGEIGVSHRARQFGQSKYGITRTIRVVLDLLAVLFFMKYRARPGHFFGTLGMGIGLVGSAMLSAVFVSKYVLGEDIGTRPMLLVGAFAMLSSLQLICFGIMAEIMTRIHYDSSGSPTYVVGESFANAPTRANVPAANLHARKAG